MALSLPRFFPLLTGWNNRFGFLLKGFLWLVILGSLVEAGEEPSMIESRSFQRHPKPTVAFHRKNKIPIRSTPTSFSKLIRPNPKGPKGDLAPAAQTLYDLRGFHIPLTGRAETQEYIRQQNQAQTLRQNPLIFPSFFQPQRSPQEPRLLTQNHQNLNIFGHGNYHRQTFQTQGVRPQTQPQSHSTQFFRPSQPDLGQSTTEDAFKPFNPPGLLPVKEEKQDQLNLYQQQEQRPYIYVYDDPDYEVEVSRTPIRTGKKSTQFQDVKSNSNQEKSNQLQITATPQPLPVSPEYEFFEEVELPNNFGQPNNNIPFTGFVDDYGQTGSFIPGRHYTHSPKVEIIPSSERKPPPDVRNTVPATLNKSKGNQKYEEIHPIIPPEPSPLTQFQDISESPAKISNLNQFQQNQKEEIEKEQQFPPYQPPPRFQNQQFSFEPLPKKEEALETVFEVARKPGVQNSHPAPQPLEIIPYSEGNGENYDPVLIQKLNPYIHPDPFQPQQKLRPVHTAPEPYVQNYQDAYVVDNGNVILEEIPTTIRTTTTTTTTTTAPQTSRSTTKPRRRYRFPPFPGKSATSTTSTTTTTPAPRHRRIRPRLRSRIKTPRTTTTTTTLAPTTFAPDYYEGIEPNQKQTPSGNFYYNSIEEDQEYGHGPTVPTTFNRFENHREIPKARKASRRPKPYRGHHHRGSNTKELEETSLGFQENGNFDSSKQLLRPESLRPEPTPNIEQQIYEETPTIQVKTRTRFNPPFTKPPTQRHRSRNHSRRPTPNSFVVASPQPPSRQRSRNQNHFIPEFAPFPERPREEAFFHQIPRGRKQGFSNQPRHRSQSRKPSGKPLYITGKMLEKEGGLYAGYQVQPQHHMYGYGPLPLSFIPMPNPPPAPTVIEQIHQPKRHHLGLPKRQRERIRIISEPRLQKSEHHHSELRRPTAPSPTRSRQEETTEPVPAPPKFETVTRFSKSRSRIRLMSSGRRRQKKIRKNEAQRSRNEPEAESLIQTSPSPSIRVEQFKPHYQTKPLVITEGLTPPPTLQIFQNNRETSPPSQEIELPPTPKPNPIRRRPFKKIRISGPITTTTVPTTVPTPTRRLLRKLRPRPKFMRTLQSLYASKGREPVGTSSQTQSVRISRKPTQAPGKFSSKFKEEDIIYATPPPEISTTPEESYLESEETSSPTPTPKFIPKTHPVESIKKFQPPTEIQTTTTPKPVAPTEEAAPPAIPTSILLSAKDVILNRKPARRIPPGSASDRLKALQERRRRRYKIRPVKLINHEDRPRYLRKEPYASNSDQIQSKREIRVSEQAQVRPKFFQSTKRVENSSEPDSAETADVLGLPKPTTEGHTEFHLFLEEAGTSSKEKPQQLKANRTGPLSLSIKELNRKMENEERPSSSPAKSPFNVFQVLQNERPLLPIEAEFSQSFPILPNRSQKQSKE